MNQRIDEAVTGRKNGGEARCFTFDLEFPAVGLRSLSRTICPRYQRGNSNSEVMHEPSVS